MKSSTFTAFLLLALTTAHPLPLPDPQSSNDVAITTTSPLAHGGVAVVYVKHQELQKRNWLPEWIRKLIEAAQERQHPREDVLLEAHAAIQNPDVLEVVEVEHLPKK